MNFVNWICVDTSDAFSTTQKFNTREEIGIRNKITFIITHSDTETGKRWRRNRTIFGYDKGEKYEDTNNGT